MCWEPGGRQEPHSQRPPTQSGQATGPAAQASRLHQSRGGTEVASHVPPSCQVGSCNSPFPIGDHTPHLAGVHPRAGQGHTDEPSTFFQLHKAPWCLCKSYGPSLPAGGESRTLKPSRGARLPPPKHTHTMKCSLARLTVSQ